MRAFFIRAALHLTVLHIVVAAAAAEDRPPGMQAVSSDDGYELREGARRILYFQAKPRSLNGRYTRADYVHPLYDLDGRVLTEDFPDDHRHHRGIFWAWHQLLVGGRHAGDPWVCRDFLAHVQDVTVLNDGAGSEENSAEPRDSRSGHEGAHPTEHTDSVAIRAEVLWKSPRIVDDLGEQKPVIRETTAIRAWRANGSMRRIDFEIRLLALLPDVRLGGSDNAKGYGGFSARVRLPQDVTFRGEYGRVKPQRLSVPASPWMDISGRFGQSDQHTGLTVLCHPSNPGFPPRWILRRARSMQNPAYPGREPIHLSQQEPLILRYALVTHQGTARAAEVERWFNDYAKQEEPDGDS